jgi:uroporphyrinogen-III decarboxylase
VVCGMTPFKWFVEMAAGIENTYYLTADCPALFEEVLDMMHAANMAELKQSLENNEAHCSADVFYHSENTSWTTESPSIYEQYCFDHLEDYSSLIHSYDKLHLIHMCGKLSRLDEQLKKGSYDGILDMAPAPTGDVQMWEAKDLFGDKVYTGGIECNTFTRATPKECYEKTCEIIEKTKDQKGILLGSGDSVPYGATIEHFRAIRQAIDDNKY